MINTFYTSKDSSMFGVPDPNGNYGSSNRVSVAASFSGGSKQALARGIGNFDISSLSGLKINSATLVLNCFTNTTEVALAWVTRCTRPTTWTELGVTWNKYDGTNAWTTACGDVDNGSSTTPPRVSFYFPIFSSPFTVRVNILNHVLDALNNRSGIVSLIIRLDDESDSGNTRGSEWYKTDAVAPGWNIEIDTGPGATSPLGRSFHPGKGVSNIGRFYQSPRDKTVTAVVTAIQKVFAYIFG